jgi:hypothetical protein
MSNGTKPRTRTCAISEDTNTRGPIGSPITSKSQCELSFGGCYRIVPFSVLCLASVEYPSFLRRAVPYPSFFCVAVGVRFDCCLFRSFSDLVVFHIFSLSPLPAQFITYSSIRSSPSPQVSYRSILLGCPISNRVRGSRLVWRCKKFDTTCHLCGLFREHLAGRCWS